MLPRVLEPEVMDSEAEARDYDAMDHGQVNRVFAADFLAFCRGADEVLDVGAGTAQIPIEVCRRHPTIRIVAVDLARAMIECARRNLDQAGLAGRVRAQLCDAKGLPFDDAAFAAVMSNSIVHHIPEPRHVLAEMVRVLKPGGALFVRDLVRPDSDAEVNRLVQLYAGAANTHQRQMFDDSLRAALTVEEVRGLMTPLGFDAKNVQQTSDRHWTFAAYKQPCAGDAMDDDATFRIVLPIVLGAPVPIMVYYRARAHNSGEKLDRLQEGWFLLIAIRLTAVPILVSIILFLIEPAWMAWSALPLPAWVRWAGAGLGLTLPALILWTFGNLGKNLTDTVVTRREHTLVTTGPYRWVRHPFYLFILLVVAVVSLVMANWFVLAAGVTLFTLLAVRVRREEAKLLERFGADYAAYQTRTGAFFPKLG